MVNPFSGPLRASDPHDPDAIESHEGMWAAIRKIQVGQARLEERIRFNWLLGLAILGMVAARWVI